jgi:hypothetical protein
MPAGSFGAGILQPLLLFNDATDRSQKSGSSAGSIFVFPGDRSLGSGSVVRFRQFHALNQKTG